MKTYKIKTEGRYYEALDKAKELGYVDAVDEYNPQSYMYLLADGNILSDSHSVVFDHSPKPEISVGEFLKLGEKPDAYVQGVHGDYRTYGEHRRDGKNIAFQCEAWDLHKYNIMSQEEYKAKYPDKLQLKGHDVEFLFENRVIKIGTVSFHAANLATIFSNMNIAGNYPRQFSDITLNDIFHFISENKEKFGL